MEELPTDIDVAVVGGGIAGLTAAIGLRGSGLRVVVLERDANLGGRARSWIDSTTGDVVDIGPHVLLTHYRNMLRLLDRLGTGGDVVWHTDKLITLIDRDPVVMRMHRSPAPFPLVPSLLGAPSVSWRDKLSNRRVVWLAMRITEEELMALDRFNARDFLRRLGVTERFIDWFWASVAMTLENVPVERCSAATLLRLFRHLIGHNHYRFGFPAVGLADLFVPPATAMLHANGTRVARNCAVDAFTDDGDAVTGVRLGDGRSIRARYCVAAVPPACLRRLLPAGWVARDSGLRRLDEFEPSPYISSYLWFARRLSREQFWARVWSPTNLNYDSYDLANIRCGWADRPSVIASNIIYSHRAHGMSDSEIIEATVRELAEFLPDAARTTIRHARVHRIPMAKPCPVPGNEHNRPEARTAIRGLFLAGDWTRTQLPASMESAARSGWLAAEQVWADLGRPRTLALPPPPLEGITGMTSRLARAWKR